MIPARMQWKATAWTPRIWSPRIWTGAICALMLGHCAIAGILCWAAGRVQLFQPFMYVWAYFSTYVIVAGPMVANSLWRHFFRRPMFALLPMPQLDLAALRDRLLMALPLLVAMPIFMGGYTAIKNLIGLTIPFTWDPTLTALDAAVHFGTDPWRLIGIENFTLTRFIDFSYTAWVPLLAFVHAFIALRAPDEPDRFRFFLVYVLSFALLGNVCAALFMSAGPFFPWSAGAVDTAFQPLMAYLWHDSADAILQATKYQDYLLQIRESGVAEFGSGISAFPSLHIAIAALYALFAWRRRRPWPLLAILFLVVMQVGSVHLAWHYAIDGYVSMIAVGCLWYVSGKLVRPHSLPDPQREAETARA